MTSFAHVQHPTEHPGVLRMERAGKNIRHLVKDASRSGATLLLAAIVAALLVVANQVVETWSEGHLLAAWIGLWAIAFASIALLATPARGIAGSLRAGLKRWNAARRQAADDRAMWQIAQTDPRVMQDLNCARTRAEAVKGYFGD